MVKTNAMTLIAAFPLEEDREFLLEMVEPAMHEGQVTLAHHNGEQLGDIEEVEDWANIMGRQTRRIAFMKRLFQCLEGSLPQ